VRHLLGFLKPYRRQIGLAVALVFLQSLAELYLPTLMASIVDEGVVPGNTAHIWRVGGWMLVVAALGVAAAASATYFAARTANGFGRDVRRRVFQQVSRFSLSELHQLGTATLITRTTNDVAQVQQVVFMMMRLMISAPLMAVGGVVMAVSKTGISHP